MLTLLDLGRHFGEPGYNRAIPAAVPVQGLSQERADLAGKVLLELHIHGSCSPRAGPAGQNSWRAHSRDVLGAQQCSSSSRSWCLGQDGRVSCHGKHREELSVSCLDQRDEDPCSGMRMRIPLHRETSPAQGSPSLPLSSSRRTPSFPAQLSIPGSCQQHQCPAQLFVQLLSAKETPFLSSPGTSLAKPAASRRQRSPDCTRLFWSVCRWGFFGFFFTLNSARHRFGMEKPGSCLGQGCSVSLGVALRVRVLGQCPEEVNAQHTDRWAASPKCRMQGAELEKGLSSKS